jgi:phage-related protein
VQFSAKGADALSEAIKGVKEKLADIVKGADIAGKAMRTAFDAAGASLSIFAGLTGTVQGEALSLRFQMLSREIASLFIPQIQAAINALGRLVEWLRNLSGEQQSNLAGWIVGASAAFKFGSVLGGLLGPIGAVVGALLGIGTGILVGKNGFSELLAVFRPAWDAISAGFAELKPQLMALVAELQPLINAFIRLAALSIRAVFIGLTEALKALVPILRYVVEQFRLLAEQYLPQDFFKPLAPATQREKPRQDVTLARTGVESVQDTFRRLQQASLRQDVADVPKQQLEKLGFIDEKLGFIATGVRLKKPVFTD